MDDSEDDYYRDRDLPEEVFTELGRMTLAAVRLEDTVYSLCRFIRPRHGPWDDCPISTHIGEALNDLATCPADEMRATAEAWLKEALAALAARNSVLHAAVISSVASEAQGHRDAVGQWLLHFPRKKTEPPVRTPLTLEGIAPIRRRLERARNGWMGLATHEWACYPKR